MMFAKSFVINLPFKGDRLSAFQASIPACFGDVEVWPAVHGDSISHPDWWSAGAGAWGCYRSHLQILEHCYQKDIESYIVFEDDAIFRQDAEQLATQFMADVPNDWEQIYLGGQLLHEVQHPPKRATDNAYMPFNVNRTHCFAVHRRGYETLYKHLNATPFSNAEHIDHHLGRLHESGRFRVYCPGKWIVGQDGGPSNISGSNNPATFWVDPEKLADASRRWQQRIPPAVFLEAPIDVAIELERRGWHRGKWQTGERLDAGVCNALGSLDVRGGLKQWYDAVSSEARQQDAKCACLHHPNLLWACVSSLGFAQFARIVATSADDAERQLTAITEPVGAAA